MTTLSPFGATKMDVASADDKMEVGTSPIPQVEDIDFDLDPVREHSMDRSMADEGEDTGKIVDHTDNPDGFYGNDDDMIEDEMLQDQYNGDATDMSMETYNQHDTYPQDEEVLYDYEGIGSLEMANAQDDGLENFEAEANEKLTTMPEQAADRNKERADHGQSDDITQPDATTGVSEIQTGVSEKAAVQSTSNETGASEQDDAATETNVVDFAVEETAARDLEDENAQDVIDSTSEPAPTAIAGEPLRLDDSHHAGTDLQHEALQDEQVQDHVPVQLESTPLQKLSSEPSTVSEPTVAAGVANPLHPVTISYLGQDMSLFPPMVSDSSATFFLSDATLAYEPFAKLLAACREILGDSLEHDDELVLDIPALGLHICEDSKYASQLNLSQVVDVFISLSKNENVDNLEPIYCNLSSRVCLASQYAYLLSSAQEGKTYTEITAEYLDSPDVEELSHQELSADGATNEDVTEIDHGTNVGVNLDANAILESEGVHTDYADAHDELDTSSHVPFDEPTGKDDYTFATDNHEQAEPSELSESTKYTRSHQGQPLDLDTETQNESEKVDDNQDWPEITDNEPQTLDAEELHEEVTVQHDDASNSSHTLENESQNHFVNVTAEDQELGQFEDDVDRGNYEYESAEADTYDLQNELSHERENDENNVSFDDQDDEAVPNLGEAETATGLANEDLEEHDYFDENEETIDHGSPPEAVDDGDQIRNVDENDDLAAIDESASLNVDRPDLDVPITPSKHNGSKRKVLEEEEDLDFLDLSTPEPKRTRAS